MVRFYLLLVPSPKCAILYRNSFSHTGERGRERQSEMMILEEYFSEKEIKILQESTFKLKYYPGFILNYANLDGINNMYLHSSDNEDSFENVVITKEIDTAKYFKTLLEPFEILKKYNLDKKMYFVLIFKDKHIESDFIYSKAFGWFLEKTKGINILIECSDTNVKDLMEKSHNLRIKYNLTIRSK